MKLIQPIEPGTGIQKSIEVHLPEHGLKFEVQHSLTNQGEKNIQLAPWAITIFPLGGATILPLRGLDEQPEGILPDRRVVLWPYTDIEDPRIQLTNNFLILKGQAAMPPAKVGAYSPLGWVGYLGENTFVLRRFEVSPEDTLADMGCNIESYCSDKIIELETLGAFSELKPGKQVTFSEQWEIFPNMNYPATTDGIRQLRADLKV